MIKECIVLNGEVINVGSWDYQYIEVNGEQVAQNPLPEGATEEEREFIEIDGGLYPADYVPPKSEQQLRIEQLEEQLSVLNTNNIDFMEMVLQSLGVE